MTAQAFLCLWIVILRIKIYSNSVQQLTAFLNKKKIFVLYMDKQSRDEFLEAYPAFNNVQDVTLADTDYRQAAQMAYEALSDYDKEEKSYA